MMTHYELQNYLRRIDRNKKFKKLLKHLFIYIKPFLNWRFLICFMIPWMITNGIWYIGAFIGVKLEIRWMAILCSSYLVWLYNPLACEKLLIIPIALWLCKILFKNHEKTRNDLNNMLTTAKSDFKKAVNKVKNLFKKKKNNSLK